VGIDKELSDVISDSHAFVPERIPHGDCCSVLCNATRGYDFFPVFVIARTLFSRRSRRLVRYDCRGFTNGFQSTVETDVTEESPQDQRGRSERERQSSGSGAIHTYSGGGTKACIESRNANASNVDTASPFERSLNLSRHSSHPFSPRESEPSTGRSGCAHPPRVFLRCSGTERKTHARAPRTSGWKDPQSIGCAGFSMTINDQIRETSIRAYVRVLLATSAASARAPRTLVLARLRIGVHPKEDRPDINIPTHAHVYTHVYACVRAYTYKIARVEYRGSSEERGITWQNGRAETLSRGKGWTEGRGGGEVEGEGIYARTERHDDWTGGLQRASSIFP